MSDMPTGEMKKTLGLTGLTSNAMALIAPGAFLWLTFFIQATTGQTAPAMWWGVLGALVLCLSTAVCYAEMAKLYPGTGSSYYFAEQAFLNRDRAWKYARISKFIVGWASHLYYWIYPGVMVGTMGIVSGYLVGTLYPNFMSASNPGMLFMMVVAVVFAFAVAYIAYRGVNSSTAINLGINVIQITALLVFAVLALGYRSSHPAGSVAWQFDSSSGEAYTYEFKTTTTVDKGVSTDTIVRDSSGVPMPKLDANGKPVPFHISYPERDATGAFLTHGSAASVVSPHHFSWVFIQATVAILILVGFESVTAMGGEAKNAKRDVPIAVITSLLVQGVLFYFFEYFAANFFLNSGYTMVSASGSAAPIGDMMIIVGDALFGQGHGRTFMLFEAATVVLALIGTTLSCMNTGARVTYAMGKDQEVTNRFGLLHDQKLTPHRAIWTLAAISAVVGCVAVLMVFGDAGAPTDAAIATIPHGIWSSFGYSSHAKMAALPNSLLTVTLASNFGTFILYALSCTLCMVAYHKHPKFNALLHLFIPGFGLIANLACMGFYLVGPVMGYGTSKEPLLALAIAAVWGIYGALHFVGKSKSSGKSVLVESRPVTAE
ncbi:APC family permease [Granulicella paludicola]|uniref:APC family permease n=1 Tax=Granulicella paludicola TaxID=474951 RepID=UPI0021E0B380|nr:APC family permease [Granulicella paludicola]